MEEHVTISCNKKEGKKCLCNWVILAILVALFTFVIGLIIGAALSSGILGALAAIIVLAVILLILIIVQVILLICCKDKTNKRKCERD